MSCTSCDGTGWKARSSVTASGASSAASAGASRSRARLFADARIPRRYQHCDFANFRDYNESLTPREDAGARSSPTRFPAVDHGLFLEGPPGVGKTHLAVAVLRHVVAATSARALFYDTRDLLRVIRSTYDPVVRTTETRGAAPRDAGRPPRARRPRRREDLRVGRGDAEPDRQHAVQRAARDDLHVELPGHARTRPTRTRCCAGSASGCGRASTRCATSSSSTAPTSASRRANADRQGAARAVGR